MINPTSRPTILAINPGTRYIGFAVFVGNDLVDWGMKVLAGKWTADKPSKAVRIIQRLISDNCASILAIKELHPSRSSPELDSLCQHFSDTATMNGLSVSRYSVEDLRKLDSIAECFNKGQIADFLARRYPALARYLEQENAASNPYHIRMFEAVALGLVCHINPRHSLINNS